MGQGSLRELNFPSKNIIIHQVLDAADMTIDLKNLRLNPETSELKDSLHDSPRVSGLSNRHMAFGEDQIHNSALRCQSPSV